VPGLRRNNPGHLGVAFERPRLTLTVDIVDGMDIVDIMDIMDTVDTDL
jgi:hypothetical protein